MSKKADNLVLAGLALAGGYALLKQTTKYNFHNKVALVTGGSRGLGLVLARMLADRGAKVAICARDADELERARRDIAQSGHEVFAGVCDVREDKQVQQLVCDVTTAIGPVDVLINCAGVIQVGPLETLTRQDFENMMLTHFWGPFNAMDAVVPSMRERGGGRIVNISSIGGKIAVPHLSAYCASKFALSGLSKGMGYELAKDNIKVTTVYPGLMRTGSHINARFKGQNEKEFAMFSLMDATPLTTTSAERAARQIIRACASGRSELIITVQAKLAARFASLAPELTADIMALTSRMLPGRGGIGTESLPGFQSTSAVSPSPLTALIDQASRDNNEVQAKSLE